MCELHKTAMLNMKSLDKYICRVTYSKLCAFILVCYFRTIRYLIIVLKEQLKYINITGQYDTVGTYVFYIETQPERHTDEMAELTRLLEMCQGGKKEESPGYGFMGARCLIL